MAVAKMTWALVDRVTVRRVGNSFIGEARTHANFATGEILSDPVAAMNSAAAALDAILRPMWEARQARSSSQAAADEFEGML